MGGCLGGWRAPRAEIGFWLLPEARGRGVATRAVCVFCRWAFAELALARIQASADVDNPASQRVLEKAGFTREGVMRSYQTRPDGSRADFALYSLLPGEISSPA